ncbi:hypothetical protein [Streptomyces sp. NPDC056361]|uniref:hypothetical protein n=1 Tax=Streptomyces sp. NPDC056361 TaxID=3345795 RepID=UPI0035DB77B8
MRDGQRPIHACGPKHTKALRRDRDRRAYADEELWSGRLARAAAADGRMSMEQLSQAAGLTSDQLARAAVWAGQEHHAPVPRPTTAPTPVRADR